MDKKYFDLSSVLGFGWDVMKANLGFFAAVIAILFVVTFIPAFIDGFVSSSMGGPAQSVWGILYFVFSQAVSIVMTIGLIRIALSFCDETMPTVGMLFNAKGCFLGYIGTQLLYLLIVAGGFVLLIVPGVIWAVKFSLAPYFVIDKGLSPIEALKASARTTKGVKWELFGFGLLCCLINMLGVLCFFIGIFATYPTVIVATALVYRQLAAQTPQLAEFQTEIRQDELQEISPNENIQ